MTQRYEASDAVSVPVDVIGPDNTEAGLWDDEFPADGRHALTIGDPWASAYAVVGTLPELVALAGRITAAVHAAVHAAAAQPAAVTGDAGEEHPTD